MRVDNRTILRNNRVRFFLTYNELINEKNLEIGIPCVTLGTEFQGDGGGKFFITEEPNKPNNVTVVDGSVSIRECGGFGQEHGSEGMINTWAGTLQPGETVIHTGITNMTSNPTVFVGGLRQVKTVDFDVDQVNGDITLKNPVNTVVPVCVEDVPGFKTWFGTLPAEQVYISTGLRNFSDLVQIYINGLKITEYVDYEFDKARGLLELYKPMHSDTIVCIDDYGRNSNHFQIASEDALGVIKIGSGLTVDKFGTLSVVAQDMLIPTASANVAGIIKIGKNIDISEDGTISTHDPYTLPISSAGTLGGVKIGSGLSVTSDGTLSLSPLPIGSKSTKGIIQVGDNLNDLDGVINVPLANGTETPGVVKAGSNISISSGIIDVPAANGSVVAGVVKAGDNIDISSGVISVPIATQDKAGVIKVGTGLSISDGVLSMDGSAFASTQYVDNKITDLIGGAPETLDTIKEVADAIEANKGIMEALNASIGTKLGKTETAANSTLLDGTSKSEIISTARNGLLETSTFTTHESLMVSASNNGHMSSEDKAKLDGIAQGANNYVLPISSDSTLGGIKIGANITITEDGTISTHAPYVHPDTPEIRHVTDTEKTSWNNKAPGGYGLGTMCTTFTNVDTDLNTGFYMAQSATGDVIGGHAWKYHIIMKHNNQFNAHLALDFDGGIFAFRTKSNGVASEWKKIYHEGNLDLSTFIRSDVENQVINGNLLVTGNIGYTSDIRCKTDITTIPDALNKVEKLKGVDFTLLSNGERSSGFIAQDVEKVMPHLVHTDMDGYKSVSYANFVGLLVEAIKELSIKVKELEKKVGM